MKSPIRLLALDLDGTVLTNDKHISPVTRTALEKAIAAGVTVLPASGRPLTGITQEFLDIPGVNYALTSNGAVVYRLSDGVQIHADYLDTQLAADLMRQFLQLNLMATFFADGKGYATASQLDLLPQLSISEPVRAYLRNSRIVLDDPVEYILTHGHVEKFTLNFLHDTDDHWVDEAPLRAILAQHPTLSVVSGGTDNLEITAPTASKGHAMLALAAHLGIPQEQTMACGDSENDVEMLRSAGLSVAMANSEDCVFQTAKVVTTSNEEDGVAKAIYDYIL